MTALVTGPTRVPFPFGLFSVLPFRVDTADRWLNGVHFETLGDAPEARGLSFDAACDPDSEIDLDGEGLTIVDAEPFDIYATYQCSVVGNSLDLANEVARARLEENEERFVESALATGEFGQSPNFKDDAEVRLSGGDAKPSVGEAVALLENAASEEYGTQGIFHVSRGTASLMLKEGVAEKRGQRLYTNLGTPVVAGSGYDFDNLVMTPQFVAYRGTLMIPGDPKMLVDRSDNTITAIAMRPYLIGLDSLPIMSMEFAEALESFEGLN